MAMLFIFKRNSENENGSPTEQRRSYRMAPAHKDPRFIQVRPSSGPPVQGELMDVSGGGAAVGFSTGVDPGFEDGAQVTLIVNSSAHGEVLVADAAVASRVLVEKGRVRYGFEFRDPKALLRSANPAFLTLLNRRHHERVWLALSRWLVATLHCSPSQSFHIQVHDLSPDGIGFIANDLQVDLMETFRSFEVEMCIPRTDTVLRWRAAVLHASPLPIGGTLCGLVFDKASKASHQREREVLAEYCASQMARWKCA